jgi:lipopolysaccharide biosynthesis regulator YciM
MSIEWLAGLFALVLASMAAGWFLARQSARDRHGSGAAFPRVEYFKGLNFLLNEQPDKAIEVFIRMVEVDSETVETHFALASLFRRRGEVDRAIRLHQNLIARPNLMRRDRNQALRELGEDYMRAGLLDRAESLFLELTQARAHMDIALHHLVAIYEQQKDWEQAVSMRRKLESATGKSQNPVVAHYFCEMAAARREAGDWRGALTLLKRAQAFDRDNVRVGSMLGEMALADDEPRAAVRYFRHAIESDASFTSELLPRLAESFQRAGAENGIEEMAVAMLRQNPRSSAEFAIAAIVRPDLATPAIEHCFSEYVRSSPALEGLHDFLGAVLGHDIALTGRDEPAPLREALRRLLAAGATWRCEQCGYAGNTLYWQCPSCRAWGSTKPYHDFSLTPPRKSSAAAKPSASPVRVHAREKARYPFGSHGGGKRKFSADKHR